MRFPRPIRSCRKKMGPGEIEPNQDRDRDHQRQQCDQHRYGERDIQRTLLGAVGQIQRPARDHDSGDAAQLMHRQRPELSDLRDDDLALDVGALQHLRPFHLAFGRATDDDAIIMAQQRAEPVEHVRIVEIRAQRRRAGIDDIAAEARIRYISAVDDHQFGV
ncbi:hypothetical protein [Sphingomonas sp. 7/4-4]|uniref:hypothetical protein n=1 Tax=Sphingomonas sp. 7/4-4 TaxID=3018446 RepID=UPI00300E6DD4